MWKYEWKNIEKFERKMLKNGKNTFVSHQGVWKKNVKKVNHGSFCVKKHQNIKSVTKIVEKTKKSKMLEEITVKERTLKHKERKKCLKITLKLK